MCSIFHDNFFGSILISSEFKVPVKGVYVWCPGCGHGGHLEHAVDWFLGVDNKLRKMCPTGCGHICNNLITMAESMACQEIKPKSKTII